VNGVVGSTTRRLLQALLALSLWTAGAASGAAPGWIGGAPVTITRAEFLPVTAPDFPDDTDPRWRAVSLPDYWSEPGRTDGGAAGWYRFRVASPPADAAPAALRFLRGGINQAVYFNRQLIGTGGSLYEPMAFNANRPLLFRLPPSLWHESGDNWIHVYLRGYPYFIALLPFDLGSAQELQEQVRWRVLLQNDLSFAAMVLSIVLALFSLSLWLRNREQAIFLWFGVSAGFWAMFGANMSVHNIVVPGRYWLAMIHSSIDWSCATQLVFVHRFLDVRRPRIEALVLGLAGIGTLINFFGDWGLLRYGGALFNLLSVFAILYSALLAFDRWQLSRRTELLLLAAGLGLELLLALHDFGLAATRSLSWYRNSIFVMHYAAPVLLIALGWRLLDRLLAAHGEVERLNRQLERRVEEAREALERAFDQRLALAWRQAVHEERDRIHRDLHDDLGATLLSILHSAASEESADLARAALQHLRDVVSLRPEEMISLRAALQETQDEISHRARMARVELDWQHLQGADANIPAQQALHLLRIVREGVSNVLRHSRATRVAVAITRERGKLCVRISDNGQGIDGGRPRGRGMSNMRTRAAELGGDIEWLPAVPGPGTTVVLTIPLAPEEATAVRRESELVA